MLPANNDAPALPSRLTFWAAVVAIGGALIYVIGAVSDGLGLWERFFPGPPLRVDSPGLYDELEPYLKDK